MTDATPPVRPFLTDHDPGWAARAGGIAAELRGVLGPLAAQVEHIGSTSIPGMAAKPVFDFQVSVRDLDEAADAFGGPLADAGFRASPYRVDHVPAGSDDDPALWVKRLWLRREHPNGDVNLHVRRVGSPGERLALLFRDWFRANPAFVPAYARFKTVVAREVGDVGTYSDIKDPVVDLVVLFAESWAAETGWTPFGRPRA
jgi:GrpB-like predicted nucleotidyltransferase (UPF0157 family)